MSFLVIGWFLELVGILIIVSSASRLSNWIFDNWMKSTNEGFENQKKSLRKSQKKYQIIAICIIIIGLYVQLHVMFLPIEMIGYEVTTTHTNIDPELTNPMLFDVMHWTNDSISGNILNDNKEFDNLRNIFDGYSEMMVFESEYDYGDHIINYTEILLSEYPITINTTYQDYLYDQNGVIITITHSSSGSTPDHMLESIQFPAIKFEASSEIRGILYPACDTSLGCKQDYDSPAQYQYWTDDEEIIITGFLTNEEIAVLCCTTN